MLIFCSVHTENIFFQGYLLFLLSAWVVEKTKPLVLLESDVFRTVYISMWGGIESWATCEKHNMHGVCFYINRSSLCFSNWVVYTC